MAQALTSGDAIADRRHAYGEACLKDGDVTAAIDLFSQSVEAAPNWAAGWFSLGDAHEKAGENRNAIRAFQTALALDEDDLLGSGVRLARLGAGGEMSGSYIAALFDDYADRFDTHLVDKLAYRGPEIIVAAIEKACAGSGREHHFDLALDIGCGTGLMAKAIWKSVDSMHGIDISPRMIEKARASGAYHHDHLHVGDATAFLKEAQAASFDLLMAADVLVYMGDLKPLFKVAAQALAQQGLFAFTVQSQAGDGFSLGEDLRYHHSESYLRDIASDANIDVVHLSPCITRRDAGRDVPGLVAVLMKRNG
jgi:predicted TPR repeat methyltransferase